MESIGYNMTIMSRFNAKYAEINLITIIYMFFVMIIGLLGNLLVVTVYYFKTVKSCANYFILCLAGLDFLSCLLVHPFIINRIMNRNYKVVIICKIFSCLEYTSLATEVFLLLSIAIDRYYAVCRPLLYANVPKSKRRMKMSVLLSAIGGLVFSLPVLELYGVSTTDELLYHGWSCDIQGKYTGSTVLTSHKLLLMITFFLTAFILMILYGKVAKAAYLSRHGVGIANNDAHKQSAKQKTTERTKRFQRSDSMISRNQMNESNSKLRFVDVIDQELSIHQDTDETLPGVHQVRVQPNEQTEPPVDNEALRHSPGHNEAQIDLSEHIEGFHLPGNNDVKIHSQGPDELQIHPPANNDAEIHSHGQNEVAEQNNVNTNMTSIQHHETRHGNVNKKNLKATKVLFLITACFLLSWIPLWIQNIGKMVSSQFWPIGSETNVALQNLIYHLIFLNNAINPILYSVAHKHFVLDCKAFFRKIKNRFQ